MTVAEIKIYIEAYGDNKKQLLKEQQSTIYNQAYLTASFVGSLLNGKQLPSFDDIFPSDEYLKEKEQAQVQTFKSSLLALVAIKNKEV